MACRSFVPGFFETECRYLRDTLTTCEEVSLLA